MASGGEGYGEPPAGDHLQSVYRLWLVGHQLANGAAPWEDPYSFQPLAEPQTVLAGWPFGLVYWPLGALFGPVVAWNLLLLGTIVVAGLLTYLWLRALELGPWAAAIGGLAFAVAPYRLDQSASGHLLGWAAVFLPLALLGIERARVASTPRRAHGWGALTAAALASIALSGQLHLALGAVPFVLAYALVRRRRIPLFWTVAGSARRSGGRPPRPLHAHRRVGRGPGALARRRAQVPGRVGRPLQPLAPARERGVRLLRLAHARARRRRTGRPLAWTPLAGRAARAGGDCPDPPRARDEPPDVLGALARAPAAPLPAGARALHAHRRPRAGRPARVRRRRARPAGRAERDGGGGRPARPGRARPRNAARVGNRGRP